MIRRVKTVTAKSGTTASDRRVLVDVNSTTAAPTSASDGELLQQNEVIHLLFTVSGTDPVFRVRLWFYSQISGQWHKGEQVVVNASDVVTVEVQGLDRVYLQSETSPAGTTPVLNAWVALARPV